MTTIPECQFDILGARYAWVPLYLWTAQFDLSAESKPWCRDWHYFICLHQTLPYRRSEKQFILNMPRLRAIGMLESGDTQRVVAQRLGCSQVTICNLATRYRDTNAAADRQRSGRPRVTTRAEDRHILLTHLRDRFRPATRTAAETPGLQNPRISASAFLWSSGEKTISRPGPATDSPSQQAKMEPAAPEVDAAGMATSPLQRWISVLCGRPRWARTSVA